MSWRPRNLRRWLSLNRGRGRGRHNLTLLLATNPTASTPSRRVPAANRRVPQTLAGSDATTAATTALEDKSPPALASPVNRLGLSTESGRRRQITPRGRTRSPLSITRGWHCDGGYGSSATLSSVAELIAFKTFACALFI